MKKLRFRIYYHWDLVVKDNEIKQIIDKFLLKNIGNKNKDVYYMIEDIRQTSKEKDEFFWKK